jgi:hypothetical protein
MARRASRVLLEHGLELNGERLAHQQSAIGQALMGLARHNQENAPAIGRRGNGVERPGPA